MQMTWKYNGKDSLGKLTTWCRIRCNISGPRLDTYCVCTVQGLLLSGDTCTKPFQTAPENTCQNTPHCVASASCIQNRTNCVNRKMKRVGGPSQILLRTAIKAWASPALRNGSTFKCMTFSGTHMVFWTLFDTDFKTNSCFLLILENNKGRCEIE